MSRKKIVQLIAICFLVLAVILLIPSTDWSKNVSIVGFISLVFGTIGSIISIFIPTSYVFFFDEKDWIKTDSYYRIIITSKKHGLGLSPKTQMYTFDDGAYNIATTDISHNGLGDITVTVFRPYKGKFIVS